MAKMTSCKMCGAAVSSSAKTCPRCGAKLKGGAGKIILIILAVIIVLAIVGSLFGGSSDSGSSSNAASSASASSQAATQTVDEHADDAVYQASGKKLETVAEPEMAFEYGYPKISGTVKNITNKTLSYVQIEINLYDADGNQIGSTLDNINNLEPGATWKYEAMGFEEGAESFKISGISSW